MKSSSFTILGARFLSAIAGLAGSALFVKILSSEEYGVYSSVMALGTIGFYLFFYWTRGMVFRYSQLKLDGDDSDGMAKRLNSFIVIISFILCLVVCVLRIFFDFDILYIVVPFIVLLMAQYNMKLEIYRIQEKYSAYSALWVSRSVLTLIFTYFLYRIGITPILAVLFGSLCGFILGYMPFRLNSSVRQSLFLSGLDKTSVKHSVLSSFSIISDQAGIFILKYSLLGLVGTAYLGNFGSKYDVIWPLFLMVIASLTTPIGVKTMKAHNDGDSERVVSLLNSGVFISACSVSLILILFNSFGAKLLNIYYPEFLYDDLIKFGNICAISVLFISVRIAFFDLFFQVVEFSHLIRKSALASLLTNLAVVPASVIVFGKESQYMSLIFINVISLIYSAGFLIQLRNIPRITSKSLGAVLIALVIAIGSLIVMNNNFVVLPHVIIMACIPVFFLCLLNKRAGGKYGAVES